MKFEFSRQIFFEKYSCIKFHENCPVGAELFHADGRKDRRTYRHDDAKRASNMPPKPSVCYLSCKQNSAELLRASGDGVRVGRLLCSGVWVPVGIAWKGVACRYDSVVNILLF